MITTHLLSCGPAIFGGMGISPVSFQEIAEWSRLTGTSLTPWEAETIRGLSRSYVSEFDKCHNKPKIPPPWLSPNGPRGDIGAGFRELIATVKADRKKP